MNINAKDLNLLNVFAALMRCKNTTDAAKELKLSQPAVSHALARLRDMFEDELFVRLPRGLAPTPFATKIEPKVSEALAKISDIFKVERAFDPSKIDRTFTIASTELFEQIALRKIVLSLVKESPLARLRSISTRGLLPKRELESGEFDLAIAGFFGDLPEGFYSQFLFENDFVCIAAQSHPRIKKSLSIDEYCQEKHLLISPQGDFKAKIDEILAKKKKSRQVIAGISNFLSPFSIVESSELVITVPRKLAAAILESYRLNAFDLPFDSPSIRVNQVWHSRNHSDPVHKWLREIVRASVPKD